MHHRAAGQPPEQQPTRCRSPPPQRPPGRQPKPRPLKENMAPPIFDAAKKETGRRLSGGQRLLDNEAKEQRPEGIAPRRNCQGQQALGPLTGTLTATPMSAPGGGLLAAGRGAPLTQSPSIPYVVFVDEEPATQQPRDLPKLPVFQATLPPPPLKGGRIAGLGGDLGSALVVCDDAAQDESAEPEAEAEIDGGSVASAVAAAVAMEVTDRHEWMASALRRRLDCVQALRAPWAAGDTNTVLDILQSTGTASDSCARSFDGTDFAGLAPAWTKAAIGRLGERVQENVGDDGGALDESAGDERRRRRLLAGALSQLSAASPERS